MLLRRISQHVREQNWFAVIIDFLIVVVGILIAFQITSWSEQRQENKLEKAYLHRLATDLDETINYLKSQDINAAETKTIIENTLAVLNNKDSRDIAVIEAVTRYISEGTYLQDFKVARTTFDDLSSTGNLGVLHNRALVQSLGQLHTNFADYNEDLLVNTDWILPIESKMAIDFDFFRFDQQTKHLYPNKSSAEILTDIRAHQDLLQRHAAFHYWYIHNLSIDYQTAIAETEPVLAMINTELEAH